jgi:hypothetical protein
MGITISKTIKKAGKPAPTNSLLLYMRAVNFARKLRVKSAISAKISKNHEH